jgi:hypothetical protein
MASIPDGAVTMARADLDNPVAYIHPDRFPDWIPDIPKAAVEPLLSCARLHSQLSKRIAEAYALKPLSGDDDLEDLDIASMGISDLSRVMHLAGAIWNGRALRGIVAGREIMNILPGFGAASFHYAIANAEAIPLREEGPGVADPSRIKADGLACFAAWLEALDEPLRQRVLLKFSPASLPAEPSPAFMPDGVVAIRRSARHIQSLQ